MHPPIGAERMSAARALCEGKPATYARVAQAMGCHHGTLQKRARLEGWKKKNFESPRVRKAWPYGGAPGGFDLSGLAALAAGSVDAHGGTPDAGETGNHGEDGDAAAGGAADQAVAVEGVGAVSLDALDRLGLLIARAANTVVADAEANGGRIDTGALEALVEAKKVFDKVEKLACAQRAEQQKRSDDELAGTLERIDDRIIELAEAHAAWLVARRDRAGEG